MASVPGISRAVSDSRWAREALDLALDSVEARLEMESFPHVTERGKWITTPDGAWTGGFWIGLLWTGYEIRGDERFRRSAERLLSRFVKRADERRNHDLGMMFYPSAVTGWELTGNERYRDAAVRAAGTLADQLNQRSGLIPGWGFFGNQDWEGVALVDTLMNLPLLLWASETTGDDRFERVALTHATTSLAHHIRPNGATYHVSRFDPHTGQPLGNDTYQGVAPDSCWARGQAWAMVGCAQLATRGAGAVYLGAAERVARWYSSHVPADLIPYWDFDAAGSNEPRDASAGAIAAYGLLLLDRLKVGLPAASLAEDTLRALVERAQAPPSYEAILLHATADLPHGIGVDESTIYGDYFFVRALREWLVDTEADARLDSPVDEAQTA